MAHTIIRGGRVLDIEKGTAEPRDILIRDDTIAEIGAPDRKSTRLNSSH